ncbi:uncharacterized protein LOC142974120 [Anticarsia gemmatalis]|uniref:uncharacterized protein LOC142974120 n=1 Tax=Anticarsia gemmatalis TaxID=129554 RepID=UPI003F766692
MGTLSLILFVIVLCLMLTILQLNYHINELKYRIHTLNHKITMLKEALEKSLEMRRAINRTVTVLVREDAKKGEGDNKIVQRLLTQLNSTDATNLHALINLINSSNQSGDTTIIQRIEGPKNNGNINIEFGINIF